MRKSAGITVVLLAVVALLFAGIWHEAALDRAQRELLAVLETNAGNYNEDRVVLSSTNRREAQEMAEEFGGTLRITDSGNFAVIRLPEGVVMRDIAQNDAYRKYHDRISLDYNNFAVVTEDTDVAIDGDIRANFQTDEPMYPQQTYLDYINIGDSWNVSMGRKPDGEKVTVAVIDSGIDTDHPEFTDADGNSIISPLSYNATDDSIVNISNIGVIEDEQGHGTAVAGIIASQINGGGVMGIAPDVELLVIKCDVDETGEFKSSADIVFGIYYAIEQDVDVINMSLGGDGGKDMEDALQLAVDSGIICVAAAGNDSEDLPHYPAAYDTVIGVGALADGSWEIADYSNYGINSDIVAPGTALTPSIDGGYTYQNGTSIAAPIVSAAAAIYKTQDIYPTYEELRADLLAAGKDLGDPGEDDIYGFGALDMNAFICEPKGIILFDYCTEELENTEQVFVRQHTIQTIPEPERENIIFDDWYYDKAYTRVFDYDAWYTTEFVEDVILYAKWINEDDEDASVYNYHTLSDGTIEIVNYMGKRRYLTIPNEIDGKVVSSIAANAFADNTRLREVIFPEGLVRIKEGAFSGVSRMRGITFTGTLLTDIQQMAFYNCSALRTLVLPDSVQTLGEKAFANCGSLTTVSISENSSLTTMGAFAFSRTGISGFYLPRDVRTGGFDGSVLAFSSDMRSITVHAENSAYMVEGNTLYNADKTQLIYYPASLAGSYTVGDGVDGVGAYAFAASKISDIDLNVVSSIGASAFNSSKGLTTVVIPDTVVVMENGAFQVSSIEQVVLSKNLRILSKNVFAETKLTSAYIPSGIVSIQEGAFEDCRHLTELIFDAETKLQIIGESAFENCRLLTNPQLPKTLSKIDERAFLNCYAITTLSIPANVSEIGSEAFRYCRLLQRVTFADGCVLREIPAYCFANCTMLKTVNFSDGITKLGMYAFGSDYLLSSLNFGTESSLTTVGDYCFYTCSALKTIQLPDTVTSIGQFAYAFTGLTEVKLSANVASVGNAAFGACYALDTITADENNAVYSAVDNVLFSKDIDMVYCVPSSRTGSYALPETVKITAPYSFYYDKFLTDVILPDGLEDIQMNSFYNCSSLAGISIPTNVTNIGRKAFENCKKLANVTFAENSKLQRLGIYTFVNCGFAEITIPASVESMAQYVFSNCNNLRTLRFERNSKLPYVAAYLLNGTMVESVVFEDGSALSSLQAHAFDGARYLKSVDFGDASITNVDNYAFYGCTHLESIVLPEEVTFIGRYAFYDCEKLDRMDIPAAVDYIGESAFFGTNNMKVFFTADELPENVQIDWDKGVAGYFLGAVDYVVTNKWEYSVRSDGTIALVAYKGTDTELTIGEVDGYTVSRIGTRCFYDNNTLTAITLSSNITEIDNYAFYGCNALMGVDIPFSVKRIGKYAFADSNAIVMLSEDSLLNTIDSYAFSNNATTSLILPDSVTVIGDGAFYGSDLTTLSISETSGLTTIGQKAFEGSGITEIYLPASLETIGAEAFKEVTVLTSVEIADGETVLKLSNSAFEGSGIQEITIPARVNYIGEYAFVGCLDLENIHVDSANTAYTELDGVLCDITGTTLIQYPGGRSGAYEVPEQIKVLTYASFKNAKGLTEVTFAESSTVRTIGWQTFSGCDSLTKITVPDSVVSFDFYAFENCTALTDVILGEGSQLTGVYEGAFYGCTALENIVLPDAVVEIGNYAFYHCSSLTAFPMTENSMIKGIYDHAFDGCTGITEIPGYSQIIEIGEYAFAYVGITEYTVPGTVNMIASNSFHGCENFTAVYCDNSNETYVAIDGALYEKGASSATDYDALVVWPYGNVLIIGAGKTEITAEDTDFLLEVPEVKWEIANTVTVIGTGAFEKHYNLTSITLPDGITEIKDSAFEKCKRITSINIPKGVNSIGSMAFGGCTNLQSITIPNSVVNIGRDAFWGCQSIETAGPIGGGYDYEFEWEEAIPDHAMTNCWGLISLTIPEGIKSIGDSAFADCLHLSEIYFNATEMYDFPERHFVFAESGRSDEGIKLVIGKKVNRIPANLFYTLGTSYITSIMFEDGSECEQIGDYAFASCGKLSKVTIPASVTTMGKQVFRSCHNLTSAGPVGSGCDYEYGWTTSIPAKAFQYCQGLTYVMIPESITTVGPDVFLWSQKLTSAGPIGGGYSIEFGWTEKIPNNTFRNCYFLTSIHIPNSVTAIGNYAFYRCVELESIDLPDNLQSIGSYAFSCCQILTNVHTPSSLQSIGDNAFSECYALSTIRIGENVDCIGEDVFHNCGQLLVIIEADDLPSVLGDDWSGYSAICIRPKIVADTDSGISYWLDQTNQATVWRYTGTEQQVDIPASIDGYPVVAIANGTFYNRWDLRSICIPDGITSIGDQAFYYCHRLTEMILPNGVISIGEKAFYHCTSIERISLPASVEHIGSYAFYECTSLQDITIPEGITTIRQYAFYGCSSLKSLVIPEKIRYLEKYAFAYCNNLEAIYYNAIAMDVLGTDPFWKCGCNGAGIVVTVGADVTRIPDYLFGNTTTNYASSMPNIICVVFEKGSVCESIGYAAFIYSTKLKSVQIPSGIVTVESLAFSGCTDLMFVQIDSPIIASVLQEEYSCGYLTAHAKAISFSEACIEIGSYISQNYSTIENVQVDRTGYTLYSDHSHEWVVQSTTELIECVQDECTIYCCTICGAVNENVSSCHDLQMHEGQKSTCLEAGWAEYATCKRCGYSTYQEIPPLGHSYESFVAAPTCMEQGYTTYTCVSCGDGYVGDYTGALGHDMAEWKSTTKATCTEKGEEIRECSRCDYCESRDIEPTGHDWDKGIVTIEPTEEHEGEMIYICRTCFETRTEVIPKLEHEHRYEAAITEPTCSERGFTTHTCRCGESYVDGYMDALGHDMGEWFTLTEATCTKAGSERRDCSRCDHHETQVIEAAGHDYESVATEPTCTEQGFTTHTCVNCGDSYMDSYTDALGHSFTAYISDDNATCTQDGTKTAVCDRCNASDTVIDEGSAHGHDFTEWTVIMKPTETAEGLESRCCLRCGVEETRTIARLENPFADVPSDSFYYEPVMWAVANGITNGTSATTFGPNDQCMRAHVVTFLWRAVGSPEPTWTDNPFVDVKESDFYYKAVMWALENGITSGLDATHFGPTAYCNRAQVVTFLYRTMGSPELESMDNPFADVQAGAFYEKPVLWAVQNGITNGLSATSFGPNAICNRAQIVTFLYRAFVTE